MADTTAASALASSLRNVTTATSEAAYRSSRPEHAVGKGVSIVKQNVDGSSSSMQFDASGQIIPTGKAEKAESATASAVDLLPDWSSHPARGHDTDGQTMGGA